MISSDFIQLLIFRPSHVPVIILYTEDQIQDLKRFCCGSYSSLKTILGVDKTFNLCDLWVTTTVYKNLSLVRRYRDQNNPIFCGPIFLHGNSYKVTYNIFFSPLASILRDHIKETNQMPIFGCDEEAAIRLGIDHGFNDSK